MLNELIRKYTCQVQQGEIPTAYKAILAFMGRLRADFIKKFPEDDISSIYPGYMDMTYFSFSAKTYKEKGLKVAIVYIHEKGAFEVWLSARNRTIAKRYESIHNIRISDNINLFHDENNQDAIIECLLTATPDFDHQDLLICVIWQGVEKFIAVINRLCDDFINA